MPSPREPTSEGSPGKWNTSGFREPFASEFRKAAEQWAAVADRQWHEADSVIRREPIAQVFTEPACGNQLGKRPLRRRDHPHVDLTRSGVAYAAPAAAWAAWSRTKVRVTSRCQFNSDMTWA